MADKSFGLKQVNLIGASGTPRIESPNNLNINATNVAISTDMSVGGTVTIGTGATISSPATNVLTLGTNNGERVRIDSSGNIGIGTDNSNSRQLSVYGPGVNGTQIECRATGGNSSGLAMYAGRNFEIQSTTSAEANYPSSFIVYDRDANGYRMSIDGSGRVQMPAQPGFLATSSSASAAVPATGDTADLGSRFDTIPNAASGGFNIGNHYDTSTGIFTAPVAGRYFTFFNMRWETQSFTQNSHIRIYVSINNANNFTAHQINGSNEAWANYMAMSVSSVLQLAAGDTLRPKGGLNGGTAVAYWNESSWGAYLLG